MARIIGTFSWTAQPGYPNLDGDKDDERITCVFKAPWSELAGSVPDYGDKFYDERYEYFNTFEDLELINRKIKPDKSGALAEVTLLYGTENSSGTINRDNGDEEWEVDNEPVPISITKHANYRTKWNHALLATYDWSGSNPSFWDTATDTKIPADNAKEYKWIKPDDQFDSDEWYVLAAAVKPDVEDYTIYVPAMVITRYFTRKKYLKTALANDGYRVAPPKKYCDDVGLSDSAEHWLQGPTTIGREGKYHVTKTKYQYSEIVDTDLYDEPAGS